MRTTVKIVVSICMLTILFLVYGSDELVQVITEVTVNELILITLLCTCSLFILAKRFQLILRSQQVHGKWMELFSLQLMGLTLSQFMPGVYGGDLLRVAWFMPEYPEKKKFLSAAVLFERLTGLFSLTLLGVTFSLFAGFLYDEKHWFMISLSLIILICAFAACGGVLVARSRGQKSSFRWLRLSKEIVVEVAHLFSNYGLFCTILALSFLSQLVSITVYFCLSWFFEADLSYVAVGCAVTLAWIITILPISFNGLGLREGGLVMVMIIFGTHKSVALSISLIALFPTMVHAVLGSITIAKNMKTIIHLRKIF